jgi:hypothetical protein
VLSVYIAAPFPLREIARDVCRYLQINGCDITASWLFIDDMPDADPAARLDLADVDRAQVLVLINPLKWKQDGTGGRHTEFGYAMAAGKRLVILGARTNLFHHRSDVELVDDVPAWIVRLRAIALELGAAA